MNIFLKWMSLVVFFILIMLACQSNLPSTTSNSETTDSSHSETVHPLIERVKESPAIVDTPSTKKALVSTTKQAETIIDQLDQAKNSPTLNTFLQKPIDWLAFKEAVETPNSGGADSKAYWFRPLTKGFYYHYFIFLGCRPYGLEANVYIKGKEIGRFSATNDVLIGMQGSCQLAALDKLNLVGQSLKSFQDLYGKNCLQKGLTQLYTFQGHCLFLHLQQQKDGLYIQKWQYLHTNKTAISTIADVPAELWEY